MPSLSKINVSKSLAELTGVDWGPAPTDAGTLVRERHEIRRTPVKDLSNAAIVRFLDMNSDVPILLKVALDRLRDNPDAVDLLCAVLRVDHFDWRAHLEVVRDVRERVDSTLNSIGQITDGTALEYEVAVLRFYAGFERRLSSIE